MVDLEADCDGVVGGFAGFEVDTVPMVRCRSILMSFPPKSSRSCSAGRSREIRR
jgi:hypothetical protein